HGVASGSAGDSRFPKGTLSMQHPFFLERGLDLDRFHEGTLNVSIKPHHYKIRQATYTFHKVKWSPDLPAEDFSFFDCRVGNEEAKFVEGLVYYPHPETKPEFFQDPSTLEILAPFISDLTIESRIQLQLREKQIDIA
ncbi:MAG: hypothetical protein VCA36_12605, partial [Opitutales bacterium]